MSLLIGVITPFKTGRVFDLVQLYEEKPGVCKNDETTHS